MENGCGKEDCCKLKGNGTIEKVEPSTTNGNENEVGNATVINGCGNADCCKLSGQTKHENVNGHSKASSEVLENIDFGPMKPYEAASELIFPPALRKHQMKALAFGNKRKRWLRPTTLKELLAIKELHKASKLTGGSSEIQVEIKVASLPNFSL